MFRTRRGTLAQELGHAVGGVAAFAGSVAFCKATIMPSTGTPGPEEAMVYTSTLTTGTGDLFAPWAANTTMMWMGAVLAIAGTLLRIKSYWHLAGKKDS